MAKFLRHIAAFAFLACLTVAFLACLTTGAQAQSIACGNHDEFSKVLKQQYREDVQALGITTDGSLLELYASPVGTWTIMLTRPGGPSCLVGSGTDFQIMPNRNMPQV